MDKAETELRAALERKEEGELLKEVVRRLSGRALCHALDQVQELHLHQLYFLFTADDSMDEAQDRIFRLLSLAVRQACMIQKAPIQCLLLAVIVARGRCDYRL